MGFVEDTLFGWLTGQFTKVMVDTKFYLAENQWIYAAFAFIITFFLILVARKLIVSNTKGRRR